MRPFCPTLASSMNHKATCRSGWAWTASATARASPLGESGLGVRIGARVPWPGLLARHFKGAHEPRQAGRAQALAEAPLDPGAQAWERPVASTLGLGGLLDHPGPQQGL